MFGDPAERALIGTVLVTDAHDDQVGAFLARNLDDAMARLSRPEDFRARLDRVLGGDESGRVERALDPRILFGHDQWSLERNLVDVDDDHLRLVPLIQPGSQFNGPDRCAQIENRNENLADRFHRADRAGGASWGRRWDPKHPAKRPRQADGEADRQSDTDRIEGEAQGRSRPATCSRQAPNANRPTPAMAYGMDRTWTRSRTRMSTPSTMETMPTA